MLRAAAVRGHVAAQLVYAQALLDGAGDASLAVRWLRIAAEAGYPPAANLLGRCLEKGWGTPADHPGAACWYRIAASTGDDWGRYNLANMLLRGRGVPLDRAEAWTLFRTAAGNGHAKSMNLVARFLDEGWDRPRDPARAAWWYRRSAEAGDYRGCHNFAVLLAEAGRRPEALGWWHRAVPDATPDILDAMEAILAPWPEAADLLGTVRRRSASFRDGRGIDGRTDLPSGGRTVNRFGLVRLARRWPGFGRGRVSSPP
ncbi:tetratricopeptide repeat protein [Rhizosaccharibacter radicis]|uniref:Sel1 repeat family protein n=1 Tax=Rhizosaccharibacter radicis TaxID=2782605 RepID=A0ABT1VVE5_9PROT|nr:sel1 repeat family protein [Acetobacteraceae bacterium KSS12]